MFAKNSILFLFLFPYFLAENSFRSFLFFLDSLPLYDDTTVTHSTDDGHLGCLLQAMLVFLQMYPGTCVYKFP